VLITVGEFCEVVEKNIDSLIGELQALTDREGDAERLAWKRSLPSLAGILRNKELNHFHLYLHDRGRLSVEYRLPASSYWCDVVLLGQDNAGPSVVIIELKDWDTVNDRPGPREALIDHRGTLEHHPSDQVRGYTEYCRRFHSAILETNASISGCVYFTRASFSRPYCAPPHNQLVADYPIFTQDPDDIDMHFPSYLSGHLKRADGDFALKFERGIYHQDRDFCKQMAEQITDPKSSPFVLVGGQRMGFELCRQKIQESLNNGSQDGKKTVILVEGPPGSGKSVLAARLWADLVCDPNLPDGSVVLTTTSSSQRSNWESLFNRMARGRAGAGIVKPANQYAPDTTTWVGKHKKNWKSLSPDEWRENVELCRQEQGELRCPDNSFLISIVDEAHALINPEKPKARSGRAGWPIAFGPQAYHIMRCSRVTVFLMDSEQSFRDRETTSREDILGWATELGASVPDPISLAGSQFRAGGSAEYMDWLEGVLDLRSMPNKNRWRCTPSNPDGKMVFEIVDDPQALDDALRPLVNSGESARLLAAYGREWKTKVARNPHALPPQNKDFCISYKRNETSRQWSKIWNFAPGTSPDYTLFVQAPIGSVMHQDCLSEVGCPYVVRGFDWSYVGVLWLKDLIWRDGRWQYDLDYIHESGISITRGNAKKEGNLDGPASKELVRRLKQAYRILLSRAMRGVYLWFEDEETRRHVESLLLA
jgi:uncharacterized protein